MVARGGPVHHAINTVKGYYTEVVIRLSDWYKLILSIYTLEDLRNPQLQRDVHRSQNRIEAYHQLRAAISGSSVG